MVYENGVPPELVERLERLAAAVAPHPGEARGWAEDHERGEVYRACFDAPALWPDLLELMTLEQDRSSVSWVMVQMVEREDDDAAATWLALDPTNDYAARRWREVSVLRGLAAGATFDAAALDGWTDWLQRRLVTTTARSDVLDALAADGRTRRVRAAAAERIRKRRARRP